MTPVRGLLHGECRGDRGPISVPESINSNDCIMHGKHYASAFSDPKFKRSLVNFVMSVFQEKAKSSLTDGQELYLDYENDKGVIFINSSGVSVSLSRLNNKGEADNAIFWHARVSPKANILIKAGDSDVFMYALALRDMGDLPDVQNIVVEIDNQQYVWINKGVELINSHPKLNHLSGSHCAVASVLALYLLSGSDYVSNFYLVTSEKIFKTFLKYSDFISPTSSPLVTASYDSENNQFAFESIDLERYVWLMTLTYLDHNADFY